MLTADPPKVADTCKAPVAAVYAITKNVSLVFKPAGNFQVPDPPVCALITENLTPSPTLKFR